MGLVDYSDSEESSHETVPVIAPPQSKDTAGKPSSRKVVDKSDSKKIKVSLPSVTQNKIEVSDAITGAGERPAKRAKTGGVFSGFGSLLPPPKNAAAVKNTAPGSSILAQSRGAPSSKKISLKTGATPAFSRDTQAHLDDEDDLETSVTQSLTDSISKPYRAIVEDDHNSEANNRTEEPKLTGKPVMFKPLSVSRKPTKKKPPEPGPNTSSMIASTAETDPTTEVGGPTIRPPSPPSRKKILLFSAQVEDTPAEKIVNAEYQPVMGDDEEDALLTEPNGDVIANGVGSRPPETQPHASSSDLNTLASNLGLSASERRQLFGRGGQPTNAQVAQFSLAEEYKHNQELRENEETTPVHNPIKSIAPGKHSLQQLVNAAQTNKDALDESFVRGKTNKKAAGSKYGW